MTDDDLFNEDDDSFHPLGEEWEEEMRERLEETEYDAELGMEMAKDAMRVTAGELSETEFQERYHDDMMDEFGVDERPTRAAVDDEADEDSEGFMERIRGLGEDLEDQSRRTTMKQMGAGAAAIGLGSLASGGDDDTAERHDGPRGNQPGREAEGDKRYGMVIDLERCDGCLSCVSGCIEENNTSTGANWMYVLTYEEEKTEEENFLVRPCQHCSNAPCEKVCPTTARHSRKKDGIVLTDYEICIGCRYCQVACPYGVNYFQWGDPDQPESEFDTSDLSPQEVRENFDSVEERNQHLAEENDHKYDERGRWTDSRPPKGVMGKCTYCPSRQDGHNGEEKVGTVACQEACDTAGMSVIHFGDLNDPESRPNRYLKAKNELTENEDSPEIPEEYRDSDEEFWETVTRDGDLSAFRLLEDLGTEPNVVYLGNEPGPKAEQTDGPVSYSAIGAQDNRKEYTDLGAQANSNKGIWDDDWDEIEEGLASHEGGH